MKKPIQLFLLMYSLGATVTLIIVLVFFVQSLQSIRSRNGIFDTLEAQQIKIVEPDGTLRMIISNSKKLPGVIVRGKEVEKVDRPQAGMLFLNDEGSETGGLIFSGSTNSKGEVINSGVSLSFDRYGGKEEVNLIGVHDKDDKFAGLSITDSKYGDNRTPGRIWVGRNSDGSAEISLMDSTGKKRIAFKVLENGESSINFMDTSGKITSSLSPPKDSKTIWRAGP